MGSLFHSFTFARAGSWCSRSTLTSCRCRGTFAAAIVPVIAIGLNWKGATATAATYAIASSLVVNFGVRITGVSMPYGVDVGAASLVVSLTLFLGISLLSTPDELDADVEAVMEI